MTTGVSKNEAPPLTRKDFSSDQMVRWCPGCGDYAILSSIQNTMPQLGIKKEDIASFMLCNQTSSFADATLMLLMI